jgi:hypothetical protein
MSSFVSVSPQTVVAASQDLLGIGSAIRSSNAAAAASTTQVAAAAQDEVSAAITGVFGSYAQQYQALIAQAGRFHDQFVQALSTGAGAYAATEAANVSPFTFETLRATMAQDEQMFQQATQGLIQESEQWGQGAIVTDEQIGQRAIATDARVAQGTLLTDEGILQRTIGGDEQAWQQYLKEVYLSLLAKYF